MPATVRSMLRQTGPAGFRSGRCENAGATPTPREQGMPRPLSSPQKAPPRRMRQSRSARRTALSMSTADAETSVGKNGVASLPGSPSGVAWSMAMLCSTKRRTSACRAAATTHPLSWRVPSRRQDSAPFRVGLEASRGEDDARRTDLADAPVLLALARRHHGVIRNGTGLPAWPAITMSVESAVPAESAAGPRPATIARTKDRLAQR